MTLGIIFQHVPDKQQTWEDLHRLTFDEYNDVRRRATGAIGVAFQHVPDKQQAWEDLHRLTSDKDNDVKVTAAGAMETAFQYIPDKQKAWEDLHQLISDEDSNVRWRAAGVLGYIFQYIPDKQRVWEDLIKLTSNEDNNIRLRAAEGLEYVFEHVFNKQQAWEDIHLLTFDENNDIRERAARALGYVIQSLHNKQQQIWEDVHRLTSDEDNDVRGIAAESLGYVIQYLDDKQKAWEDLHRLTFDEYNDVRRRSVGAIEISFKYLPDKQEAWENLHRLTFDEFNDVKERAAGVLGYVFQHVPDKQQVWEDLIKLSSDEESDVRVRANHSLGKISIYKASTSESNEIYISELENSIHFFERASDEALYYNPSSFCLPFYRSFYTIIHADKQQAKDEVEKYLAEAKNAVERSENKKLLLEAVENLAKALEEVQNLRNIGLEANKEELNFYRKYCEQVAELMKYTEETAPYATAAMKKGLPILDRKLKSILEEIQEKAKIACRESKGTDTEEIACAVSREVQEWEIGSQEEMTQKVEDVAYILKTKVAYLPENEYVLNKIEAMRHERDLTKQYEALLFVIGQIPTIKVVSEDVVVENINKVGQDLGIKLDNISQEMSEIRISLKPEIKEEFEISSGIEIWGTGAKHIVTIPLQEISYAELKDDLKRIKGKHINKLSKLPDRLARKIKGYLLLNDREDIIGQLT